MIGPFRGEYDFLSNFYLSPLIVGREVFGSVEHYYQGCKAFTAEDYYKVVHAPTAREAKRMGRSITINPDFEVRKRAIMLIGVTAKFMNVDQLAMRLVDTGDEELVEVNTWGDTYWGVCNGQGANWLGRILMMVREVLT